MDFLEENDVNITLQYLFQQVLCAVLPLECEGRTNGVLLFSGTDVIQHVVCGDRELWTDKASNDVVVASKVNHLTGISWKLALPKWNNMLSIE